MPAIAKHFLVGRPGVGKTTLLLEIAQRLRTVRVGGFFTQEIREAGARVGFRAETFAGLSGILAHVSRPDGPRVGKYHVDVATFERVGVAALESALTAADVILVDEIGKMELFSARFRKAVLSALASHKPLLATMMAHSEPFVDRLKARADVSIVEVTTENRERLAEELATRLFSEIR